MPNQTPSRVARNQASRAKATRTVMVAGFPELVARAAKCRLCLLVDTSPELLRKVHALFQDGCSVTALEGELASVWAARGEVLLTRKSIGQHFRAHVDFATGAEVAELLPSPPPPPAKSLAVVTPAASMVVAAMVPSAPLETVPPPVPRIEDLEAAAYFDMQELINKLRTRLAQVDEKTAFLNADGTVNTYGMMLWLKLVDTFRQALEAMNRIRNNDRLTKAILQAHTKRNTQLASAPIVARFEVVLGKVKTGAPDALAELEKFATEEVKEMLIEAGKTAIQESCEVYRLH